MGCVTGSFALKGQRRGAKQPITDFCPCRGQSNPSVTSRCGSLLRSVSADVRSSDDVIAFEGQSSTGSMLEWFRAQFAPTATFQELDVEAEAAPVGSGGVIVLDTFQGCRTPHADGKARGAIWGMSLATTRGHLFRALLEGIAYGTRAMAESAAAAGAGCGVSEHRAGGLLMPSLRRLAVVGGATKSPTFMQLLADVVGLPLITVGAGDQACAVAAAVVATSGYTGQTLATVSKAFVNDDVIYTPDAAKHAEYAFYYQQHQETYARLKPGFHAMASHLAL